MDISTDKPSRVVTAAMKSACLPFQGMGSRHEMKLFMMLLVLYNKIMMLILIPVRIRRFYSHTRLSYHYPFATQIAATGMRQRW